MTVASLLLPGTNLDVAEQRYYLPMLHCYEFIDPEHYPAGGPSHAYGKDFCRPGGIANTRGPQARP